MEGFAEENGGLFLVVDNLENVGANAVVGRVRPYDNGCVFNDEEERGVPSDCVACVLKTCLSVMAGEFASRVGRGRRVR